MPKIRHQKVLPSQKGGRLVLQMLYILKWLNLQFCWTNNIAVWTGVTHYLQKTIQHKVWVVGILLI